MHRKPWWSAFFRWFLRPALVVALLLILWRYFSGLEIAPVLERLRGMGLAALLIPLPYALVFLSESLAWRLTIRLVGGMPPPALGGVFLVRMATDALLYSIPGGVAVAEPMRPILLRRQCGIDLTEGIGSCIITKINIAVAQAAYILIGLILVVIFAPQVAASMGLGEGMTGLAVVSLALLAAVALLTLPFSGPRLEQIRRALQRIPLRPLRTLLERGEPYIAQLDSHVGRFARDHTGRFLLSLLCSFCAWVAVAVETFLILSLLGVHPTATQAVALESTASLFRIVFFFLPGGLGASEVGFVTLLVAFGFPDPITLSAAYIAVKRLKEAAWIVAGYAVFWFVGFNPFRARTT